MQRAIRQQEGSSHRPPTSLTLAIFSRNWISTHKSQTLLSQTIRVIIVSTNGKHRRCTSILLRRRWPPLHQQRPKLSIISLLIILSMKMHTWHHQHLLIVNSLELSRVAQTTSRTQGRKSLKTSSSISSSRPKLNKSNKISYSISSSNKTTSKEEIGLEMTDHKTDLQMQQ